MMQEAKKVILYGVGSIELRRDVEYFLDDSYEIIGYSDSHYTYDSLDGAQFFSVQELCNQIFDYILLLSFQENILCEMQEYLLSFGIPRDKIIWPTIFLHRNAEKYQLDLIADIHRGLEGAQGVIFGLSYSQRDICTKLLDIPFYDCSWSSLDLYYNYRLFQYMETRQMLTEVKIAILFFPYYYFDYDMSLSLQQYKNGRIFSTWRLDDWHHYRQIPRGQDYVANYRMFGEKISRFYHLQRYEMQNRNTYQGELGAATLEKIWFRSHPITVEENKLILSEFLCHLHRVGITPVLMIPPLYLEGLTQESQNAFKQKRKIFYHILEEIEKRINLSLNVLDYSLLCFNKREYFMDITHLNSTGAKMFTTTINQEIMQA